MWFTKACERKCYTENFTVKNVIVCLTECMDKERDDFERGQEFEKKKQDNRRKEMDAHPRSASR